MIYIYIHHGIDEDGSMDHFIGPPPSIFTRFPRNASRLGVPEQRGGLPRRVAGGLGLLGPLAPAAEEDSQIPSP